MAECLYVSLCTSLLFDPQVIIQGRKGQTFTTGMGIDDIFITDKLCQRRKFKTPGEYKVTAKPIISFRPVS